MRRYESACYGVNAGVAQLVEQLICNQQVGGSSPSTSSTKQLHMGEFPSGQRGQTVNLLRHASVVRIHLLPPNQNNPNFLLIGETFGFLVLCSYLKEQ